MSDAPGGTRDDADGALAPRGSDAPAEDAAAPPSPPPAPGRAATAIAAACFVVVLLNAFLLASWALLEALPGRVRTVVVGAEVAGILLPTLAAGWALRRAGFRLGPRSRLDPRNLVPIAGMVAFGLAVSWCLLVLWTVLLDQRGWAWVDEARRRMLDAYGPLLDVAGGWEALGLVLTVALVPAACEELAFRGCLQSLLRTRWSATASITVTALLFSAFHGDVLGFPARVFIGVALGWVFERTGSLLAAALLHGAHNLVTVTVALSLGGLADPTLEADPSDLLPYLPVVALALVASFAAWTLAAKLLVPRPSQAAA